MFSQNEIRAREFAASTGHPYELCLKALQVVAWCQANPQGGVVNGQTYDARATAAQLAEAMKFLTPPQAAQPAAPAAPAAPSAPAPSANTTITSPPVGSGGLSNRPATLVGRSPNDPQRMAEQRARQQRQDEYDRANGAGPVRSVRLFLQGSFTGFSGNFSFRTNDGEFWRQTDGVVTQQSPAIMNPAAVVTVNSNGTVGILEVVGVPGTIRVELVR
ncbi:MAG: hypothetical protein B7Z37_25770 [Verrucomicrobia bacterium 12-59-8]|nr:MAG: hypothetical protein B7Z37_25770 [Verrucomicrobia bacterium 12-59-8]